MSDMYRPDKLDKWNVPLPEELLPLRETLAERIHDTWAAGKLADGWRWGPRLDEARRTHPSLLPYGQLSESEKEYDRRTAAATIRCMLEEGWRVEPPEN